MTAADALVALRGVVVALERLGVLRVQGDRLDRGYLVCWAAELGVKDLLEKALQEASH